MGVQISGDTGNVLATKGTYTGNLTVGGVLTYEDETNVDSVGLVTARSGIEIAGIPEVASMLSIDDELSESPKVVIPVTLEFPVTTKSSP